MAKHGTDLYEILGVSSQATDLEIRKAYHNLAIKYHPDKNPNNANVGERFRAINAAYKVLSDKTKRREYDLQRLSHPTGTWPEEFDPLFDSTDQRDPLYLLRLLLGSAFCCSLHRDNQVYRRSEASDDIGCTRRNQFNRRMHREKSLANGLHGRNVFDVLRRNILNLVSRPRRDGSSSTVAYSRTIRTVKKNICGDSFAAQEVEIKRNCQKVIYTTFQDCQNSRVTETVRAVVNGVETVTVRENGVVKSQKVNGQERIVSNRPPKKHLL
ncbi:DnaJ domain protein-like [Tropilaelaps mercedesae]|uniref:DnaJ domain protein-like n=1 Tax=Tropilaelaps mercedesae TaxID=418985 RepID=A0A1V9XR24_9ACAR|nr:DnaJ domain protein-like [Tropilaelaps mercedesae]